MGQASQPLFGLSFGEELQLPAALEPRLKSQTRKRGGLDFFVPMKVDLGKKSNLLQEILHCFLALKPPIPKPPYPSKIQVPLW